MVIGNNYVNYAVNMEISANFLLLAPDFLISF